MQPDTSVIPGSIRLHDIAQEIEAWRVSREMPKAALIRRFPTLLGSDKTYSKLVAGDVRELDVDDWLERYATALDKIRQDSDAAGDETLWDDFTGVRAARRVFLHLLKTPGNDRYALVTGENGSGKTSLLELLKRLHSDKLVIMQAVCKVTDSAFGFLGQLILALENDYSAAAVTKLPSSLPIRLATVQERLRTRRLVIAVEEGQDLGEDALRIIKTLINTTRAAFMIMAIPTLWRKLERSNYEDALQLSGNRNGGVVKLELDSADVEKAINRRCKDHAMDRKTLSRAVRLLMEGADRKGSLKFVTRALTRALAHAAGEPVTMESIETGIREERDARTGA